MRCLEECIIFYKDTLEVSNQQDESSFFRRLGTNFGWGKMEPLDWLSPPSPWDDVTEGEWGEEEGEGEETGDLEKTEAPPSSTSSLLIFLAWFLCNFNTWDSITSRRDSIRPIISSRGTRISDCRVSNLSEASCNFVSSAGKFNKRRK